MKKKKIKIPIYSGELTIIQTDDLKKVSGELLTHARGDGMGFGFHRVCVIANV